MLAPDEGRKALEQYAYSDSNLPPDLQSFPSAVQDVDTEIQLASNQELAELATKTDPLEYGNTDRF